ncbi:hypothetical protein HanXRQr2_Chr07g0292981 [Helianthus annuus]|uniref:Uncharacterized protein n=2 Tax=Helianthus annuus TaxID=4232 RepID=A0A251T1Q5_HELAN|nr:hypothetical protein HanXRQr2_Chr07g0292981 [Helianthus annuus]KAJ0904564.1 hypothetical protein HanPSC8_Chr07g0283691 [Helianthus annuus]
MQQRLSMPPLQVQDLQQQGATSYVDLMNMPQTSSSIQDFTTSNGPQQDILQEILSVAQVSQDLINQNAWGGSYSGHHEDDFSFLANNDSNINQMQDVGWSRFVGDDHSMRSIEVGGADEHHGTDRMVENLRWVGMSNKEHDLTFWDDYKTVPLENIPSIKREEHEVQVAGDSSIHNNLEITEDPFSNNNFLDGSDLDDFTTTPNYQIYEKTKASHGLIVSTRHVSKTFFHEIVPSEIGKVQLNLGMVYDQEVVKSFGGPKPDKRVITRQNKGVSLTARSEVTIKTTMSPFVNLVFLWIYCFFHEESNNCDMKFKDDYEEEQEGRSISNVVLEKVIWPCVTLALAFSTIWVHHKY